MLRASLVVPPKQQFVSHTHSEATKSFKGWRQLEESNDKAKCAEELIVNRSMAGFRYQNVRGLLSRH
jgi:hypothetical protein